MRRSTQPRRRGRAAAPESARPETQLTRTPVPLHSQAALLVRPITVLFGGRRRIAAVAGGHDRAQHAAVDLARACLLAL